MKLLNRLTIKSLKMNRKRTIVTIVGIILATALLAAVSTMAASFQGSLVSYEKEKSGDYHYAFLDVPKDELGYIEKNKNIEKYFLTSTVGYAKLDGSINPDKPYLYIEAMDQAAFDNSAVKMVEGRLPKNSSELLISKHIDTNGGVEYQVGQTVTLDVGRRIYHPELLADSEDAEDADSTSTDNAMNMSERVMGQFDNFVYDAETLEHDTTKEYTIVGICERLSYEMEPRMAPGYTAITAMDDDLTVEQCNIYTTYTKAGLKNRDEVTADILGISTEAAGVFYGNTPAGSISEDIYDEVEKVNYECDPNNYLISYETLDFQESMTTMLVGLVTILSLIIVFTSAFCIRNSFAISVNEKMRQYGMLSSVGATSKQIKRNVYYEAFLLGIIGIPLGILSGIAACAVVIRIVSGMLTSIVSVQLQFCWSPIVVVFTIVLAIVIIFLSARRPAKAAGKVSPIEAISGNTEVKISEREVKTPKIVGKIFGIGGKLAYKNMRRNRKKYRVSVISIAVSVIVFIPLYYFMSLAFTTASYYMDDENYNLSVSTYNLATEYDTLLAATELDGVERSSLVRSAYLSADVDELKYSKDYIRVFSDWISEGVGSVHILSLGEKEYARYTKELGLKNLSEDSVIIINDFIDYDAQEQKYVVYGIYDYDRGDVIHTETEEGEKLDLTVALQTDVRPLGYEKNYGADGYFVVSDAWMDVHSKDVDPYATAFLQCEDADVIQDAVEKDLQLEDGSIDNKEQNYRETRSLYTVIAIFLYGFITVISLIGITNIFNTITTAMDLRSKEFAMLRSMGMTSKEFNRMVCLESIFYGSKALIFGVPVGVALSYLIYNRMSEGMEVGFTFPLGGVLIAIAVVALLLFTIMRYSLKRIHRQNIIETIRQDNI